MIIWKLLLSGLLGLGGFESERFLWHIMLKIGKEPAQGTVAGVNQGLDVFSMMLGLGLVGMVFLFLIGLVLTAPSTPPIDIGASK